MLLNMKVSLVNKFDSKLLNEMRLVMQLYVNGI